MKNQNTTHKPLTDMEKTSKQVESYLLNTESKRKYFWVRHSNNRGGKAGTGFNKTTSFAVSSETLFTGKYFSYKLADQESFNNALQKAFKWMRQELIKKGRCPNCCEMYCTSDHK